MTYMGIKHYKASAGAQTDGQTERQNRTLEDSLRCMISYIGDDWAAHLGTIEFAHMNLVQGSTQRIPSSTRFVCRVAHTWTAIPTSTP